MEPSPDGASPDDLPKLQRRLPVLVLEELSRLEEELDLRLWLRLASADDSERLEKREESLESESLFLEVVLDT